MQSLSTPSSSSWRQLLAVALSMSLAAPTLFAQGVLVLIDSPGESESGAESAGISKPAPLESPAPDPVSKRLFGVIPNYRSSQVLDSYQPLTTAEKYRIARSDSFDWPNFFLLAGYAVESQVASGGFSQNGGATGFAKFYARGFSDQVIGSYVTEAILPSLLHEDPRYFRLGNGTFWRRTYYATSRIFVTRMDSGKTRVYISELAGNLGVDAITTWYYPDSRSFSKGIERYGMQLGNDAISNILTEYWPDIKRRLLAMRHNLSSRS